MAARKIAVNLSQQKIEKLCKKWKIKELALFGSVLREDFDTEKSDIDVLITFLPDVVWGWDLVEMKDELEAIFGRRVDFLEKKVLEKSKNPYRREAILSTHEVIYG